jgi:hypothetical protein
MDRLDIENTVELFGQRKDDCKKYESGFYQLS